jgi:branched-chain amino acid transport system permease protein
MVLIGGLRSVTGPLVGALALIGLEEVLKANIENWKLAEGLIIMAIVVLLPGGVRQIWPMIVEPPKHRDEVRQAAPEANHV